MDWTLGYFEPLFYRDSEDLPPINLPLSLRPGIKESLAQLSDAGFHHAVTTVADKDKAEIALNGTGLLKYFEAIFGYETNKWIFGKTYSPVADYFGIQYSDAPRLMVVTGDSKSDIPLDLRVVFIEHRKGAYCDATLIEDMLEILGKKGEGNFLRGFEELLLTATEKDNSEKVVVLNERASAVLEYRKPSIAGDITIPVVKIIDPTGYERGLQPVR